jgi:phage-related protein (TIGR01555 family)
VAKVSRVRAARREANRPPPVRPTVEASEASPFSIASRRTTDGIANAIARLGVGEANQSSFATYNFNPVTRLRIVLDWAYRGSWVPRMAVDAIAEDMTREGIDLGSELDPVMKAELLAACSDEYQLWDRLCDAIKWARLYGGAGVYIMIDGQRSDTPLNIETVSKKGLQNFVVLDRWMLNPSLNDLVTDPRSINLGLPKYYDVVADAPVIARTRIHHSRFVRFEGDDIPYWQRLAENFWTLSVLEPIWDRLLAFDSTTQGVAQLMYKAHLRTLSVDGLRALLGGKDQKALEGFYAQVGLMRSFQSNEGLSLLDAKDKFEAHQYAFGGISDVMLQFAEQVSGALQIPLVRFFGQSPAGLNSTGDSDWKNYDDGIKKRQERRMKVPLIHLFLPVIARSLGIKLPSSFALTFRPLRQMTHSEKVSTAQQVTSTVSDALERGVITNRGQALKELKQSSEYTGVWTTISDKDIKEAEAEPPMPKEGEGGEEGGLGEPPGPSEDSFLPRRAAPGAPAKPTPFLPRAANDRRAMRDAAAIGLKFGKEIGFPVVIETTAGSPRWNGKVSPGHYGYFDGTLGLDGDAVDIMLGPADPLTHPIFVIGKMKADGDLEQHKVFAGYPTAVDAAADFLGIWPRAALGVTREMTIDDLRTWLQERVPTRNRLRAVT